MLEKIKLRYIIKRNKKKYKNYYEELEKSNKYLLIKRKFDFKFLYLVPKFKGIVIIISHNEIFNKKILFTIIELFPNTEIELYEKEKLLTNEDIKNIYKINRKVVLNPQYIEKRNKAKNEIYSCDINTYMLIIEKIEYLNKVCKTKFNKQDEQVMFIITQILKYIKYVDYHDYRTCMANAILLGTGVCIDFAITLYKCLTDLGIECELIQGLSRGKKEDVDSIINITKNKNHAWNQIKINDKWYNIDITWFLGKKDFNWLLVDDKTFTEKYSHLTNFKEHYCRESYDRKRIINLYEEMNKIDSVLKGFDDGDKKALI